MSLDKRSLSEVYTILTMLPADKFNAIPKDLIKAIKYNMDKEHYINWGTLQNGKMREETEKILATIYANYLSNTEEKIVINKLINLGYKKKQ